MKNNFDLKKFLVENKLTENSRLTEQPVSEVENGPKFTKTNAITRVDFPNGTSFVVGEYSHDYGMKVVAIEPVPENEREEDEVVYVNMEDGPDGISVPFNANGEEVEI